MVDRLVRFFLELQFGGCERVIEARRYGSLSARSPTDALRLATSSRSAVSPATMSTLSRLAQSLISCSVSGLNFPYNARASLSRVARNGKLVDGRNPRTGQLR
jgi:hypothetical protein